MARRMRTDERTDPDLVAAALAGDRDAVADIYDRYSTVIFTVCVRLLGNRDDAADCAAEVFLRATERLHQLREPEKLKPWLYAIARNEVARRQRRRGREVPVEAIDEMPWAWSDDSLGTSGGIGEPVLVGGTLERSDADLRDPVGASASAAAGSLGSANDLEQLLQEAAAGLTDRDRAVAELGLRQNLQGDDLADALGVTTNHAYVLVHRVRARLERAITAILIARGGRDDCAELQKILIGWDGELTVLLRKRVSRHIDRCDICGARRKLVPGALFDAAPVLAAPIAIRHRVLGEAQVATATGRPWSSDGFPRTGGTGRRPLWITGAAAVVVLALLAVVLTIGGNDSTVLAERSSVDAPADPSATTVPDTTGPPGSSPATTDLDPDLAAAAAAANASTSTTVAPGTPTTTGGVVLPPGPDGPNGPDDPNDPDQPVSGSLVANPGVVDFGALTTSQALTLTNTGGTPLAFALGGSSSALSMSPSGGAVAPGASVVVTVGLDRSSLGDTFTATITLDASDASIPIPVLAVNSIAPSIIGTPTGPNIFGIISNNPACAVQVEATDNTGVTEVEVRYTVGSTVHRAPLHAITGNQWRGQLELPMGTPPGSGKWVVAVRDAIGNETISTPIDAFNDTACSP